jgi:hypothetical protein
MKNNQDLKHTGSPQGNPTSDRAFHNAKDDKKQTGITNGGGQRSDQPLTVITLESAKSIKHVINVRITSQISRLHLAGGFVLNPFS